MSVNPRATRERGRGRIVGRPFRRDGRRGSSFGPSGTWRIGRRSASGPPRCSWPEHRTALDGQVFWLSAHGGPRIAFPPCGSGIRPKVLADHSGGPATDLHRLPYSPPHLAARRHLSRWVIKVVRSIRCQAPGFRGRSIGKSPVSPRLPIEPTRPTHRDRHDWNRRTLNTLYFIVSPCPRARAPGFSLAFRAAVPSNCRPWLLGRSPDRPIRARSVAESFRPRERAER